MLAVFVLSSLSLSLSPEHRKLFTQTDLSLSVISLSLLPKSVLYLQYSDLHDLQIKETDLPPIACRVQDRTSHDGFSQVVHEYRAQGGPYTHCILCPPVWGRLLLGIGFKRISRSQKR